MMLTSVPYQKMGAMAAASLVAVPLPLNLRLIEKTAEVGSLLPSLVVQSLVLWQWNRRK